MNQHLSRLRNHWRILLLVAAHAPLVLPYLKELWSKPEYQFFPLAILSFLMLFISRAESGSGHWTVLGKLLLLLDLLLLTAGTFFSFSPWLGWAGIVILSAAVGRSVKEFAYDRRLTYLAVLPLIVLRLPLLYDLELVHGLQRITTALSSEALLHGGLLHYRDGNTLHFPGKSFLVEEACSGVQSVFAILFLAALITCLKRRSLPHSVVLISSGIVFAGIMNTIRVLTIAVSWHEYSLDLATGVRHDLLGYACLFAAGFLLLSADEFLGFVTDPVPDVRRPGPTGLFLNPLIRLWNEYLTVIPTERQRSLVRTSRRSLEAAQLEADKRTYPEGVDRFRISNWLSFLFGCGECWAFSRNTKQLLAGTPALLAALLSIGTVWWLRHSADRPIVEQFESSFNAAVAAKDLIRQETYLRGLASLRSQEPSYLFRLGQFMIQNGKVNEGLQEIMRLTPENRPGYSEARIWLVEQSQSAKPLIRLTPEQSETQLKAVLETLPNHDQAHLLLAKQYMQAKEWKLAEHHLSEAIRIRPELSLEMARLKKLLNRPEEDVRASAQRAADVLIQRVKENRESSRYRIALAESLAIAGQQKEARELLVSGLRQKDEPELRKALSAFDSLAVEKLLRDSVFNRDAGLPVILSALSLDPENLQAIQILSLIQTLGGSIPGPSIQPAISHWKQKLEESPENDSARLALSQLLAISGEFLQSAEVLASLAETRPELRILQGSLLNRGGAHEQAEQLLQQPIATAQAALQDKPDDQNAAAIAAEGYLVLGRFQDAIQVVEPLLTAESSEELPDNHPLVAIHARAAGGLCDQLTGMTPVAADPEKSLRTLPALSDMTDIPRIIQLLTVMLECPVTRNTAIDRLARLCLTSHPISAAADDLIRKLRLEGQYGAQALNVLGMHALLASRYDKAEGFLRQANAQTRGRDPMVLNNLATAIIRGEGGSKEEALQLVNEALKLIPENPDALSTRGEVFIGMERWTDAVADLTIAVRSRGNSVEVHRLLETAYRGLPDAAMAETHQRRAAELEAAQTGGD